MKQFYVYICIIILIHNLITKIMNNSRFSIKDLKRVIPLLIKNNMGITISTSSFNNDLVEFSEETEIYIEEVFENNNNNNDIEIIFTQSFHDYDLEDHFSFRYETFHIN